MPKKAAQKKAAAKAVRQQVIQRTTIVVAPPTAAGLKLPNLKMKHSTTIYVSVAVVFLIVIAGLVIFQEVFKPFGHTIVVENIEFRSQKPAAELFAELREERSFVVSPQLVQRGPINSYMVQSLTLFSSVLIGNGKRVISMPRIVDDQKALIACQTNDGNVLANRELTSTDCLSMLSDTKYVKVKIELPDESLKRSQVLLSQDSIEIKPKSFQEINRVSFVVLVTMYENSEEIVAKINQILQQVSGGI